MRTAVHRITIGAIAFSQFWLSLLLLGLGLYLPPLLLFGLWGLINSFTLLSSSIGARKSALMWHGMFLAFFVWFDTGQGSKPRWVLELWALFGLASSFYLARVLGYLGNRDY